MREDFHYTPQTLACIRAWVRGRRSPDWIARQLGCGLETLTTICCEHGVNLVPEPVIEAAARPPEGAPFLPPEPRLDPVRRRLRNDCRPFFTEPSRDAVTALEVEAARRNTNAKTLVSVILEIIATDRLFAAVLDN